ncbi:MAG TPA: YkvA family protein, partial [Pseudomonas sp.]|nr:YkvA family protein [Pseudomonas sp.]
SGKALVSIVAGLAYFLSPLDLIPDFLLGVGLLDDVAVLAWIMRTWRGELDAFVAWRDAQSAARRRELERLPDEAEIRARSAP